MNNTIVSTALGEFKIEKLLGKGKSGYSYLICDAERKYVLKRMHDEPCHYYRFGNKLHCELEAHKRLKGLVDMPEIIEVDDPKKELIKEYIEGETASLLAARGLLTDEMFGQIFKIAERLRAHGINLDYFPANFVACAGKFYYIDYEINPYSDEWNFANWGIYYWLNSRGMDEFLKTGNPLAINIDSFSGRPIKIPFENEVLRLKKLFA